MTPTSDGGGAGTGPVSVDQRIQVLRIICATLVASPILFAAVVLYLVSSGIFTPKTLGGAEWALVGMGMVALAVAPLIQEKVGAAAAATPEDAAQRYQDAVIVGFAVREGGTLVGVVAGMLMASVPWIIGMALAGAVAMMLAWPTRSGMDAAIRRAPGGS